MMLKRDKKTIEQYMEDCIVGKILSGESIKNAYKMHFKNVEAAGTACDFPYYFDADEAGKCIEFIAHLSHSRGGATNLPFALTLWQKAMVFILFGWRMKSNKKRRYTRVYLEVARKNGKTSLAAAISLYCWLCEKEKGGEVYCIASTLAQAKICYDMVELFVRGNKNLKKIVHVVKNAMTISGTARKFVPMAKNSRFQDGANPSVIVCDEYHAAETSDSLNVLESGMGARVSPLTFICTTAGYNQCSPCFEERSQGLRCLDGQHSDDTAVYFIHKMDESDDWTDSFLWEKANPNLGAPGAITLEGLLKQFERSKTSEKLVNDFKTKNLNVWTNTNITQWFSLELWRKLQRSESYGIEEFQGRSVYAAFDLSRSTDLTSICYFALGDPALLFWRFWLPGENIYQKTEVDKVPYQQWVDGGFLHFNGQPTINLDNVLSVFESDIAGCNLIEVAIDPYNSAMVVPRLEEKGVLCVNVPQNGSTMSPLINFTENEILNFRVRHDGNPVMEWMINNASIKVNPNTELRTLSKPVRDKDVRRIDGVTAMTMAIGRAMANRYEGAQENDGCLLVI